MQPLRTAARRRLLLPLLLLRMPGAPRLQRAGGFYAGAWAQWAVSKQQAVPGQTLNCDSAF